MIADARKALYDASRPVFFDANVWLTLYAPPSDEDEYWKGEYSKVLRRVVDGNVPVFLDSTVLSEYINRYCRNEFYAYAGNTPRKSFKEFRDTERDVYQPIATSVVANVKEILELPLIKRIDGAFSQMDIDAMLNMFAEGESDWNDQQIVDICQRNSCALVTNDADFKDADIPILTCNSKLLGLIKL